MIIEPYQSDFEFLADVLVASGPENLSFSSSHKFLYDYKAKSAFVKRIMKQLEQDNVSEDVDWYEFLELAIMCKINQNSIEKIIKKLELRELKQNSENKWNHFFFLACQYCCRDVEVIEYLHDFYEKEVQPSRIDFCGRTPLHLACANQPSIEVINFLLKSETGKDMIKAKTKSQKVKNLIIVN